MKASIPYAFITNLFTRAAIIRDFWTYPEVPLFFNICLNINILYIFPIISSPKVHLAHIRIEFHLPLLCSSYQLININL